MSKYTICRTFGVLNLIVDLGFTVASIAKVIWRREDLGLKSRPINWRCPGSNLGTFVYKASDLTIGYGLGRLYLIANPSACSFTCTRLLPNVGSSQDDRETKLVTFYGQVFVKVSGEGTKFLAHQMEKSYVLPHVRNSYLPLIISPRSHPVFKCSFLTLVV